MINRLKVNGLQSKYQRLYGVLFVEVFPPIFVWKKVATVAAT